MTTARPYMEYRPEEYDSLVARWSGGEYIQVGYMADDEFRAQTIINVWDYEAGRPRTEFLSDPFEALRDAVDEHLADAQREED